MENKFLLKKQFKIQNNLLKFQIIIKILIIINLKWFLKKVFQNPITLIDHWLKDGKKLKRRHKQNNLKKNRSFTKRPNSN